MTWKWTRSLHVIRPHHFQRHHSVCSMRTSPLPSKPSALLRRPMEAFRPRKSPLSERFLGSFPSAPDISSPTSIPAASNCGGGELDEGEVFWIGADFSSPKMAHTTSSSNTHSMSHSGASRPVAPEKNFGILAALPNEEKRRTTIRNPSFLQRKSSILSSASSNSNSPSSSTSARMMIPVVPKPKQEHSYSVPTGRGHQQSAPMNVPMVARRGVRIGDVEVGFEGNDEDEEMLPPHEIVARASAKESPMATFSVLEGFGRTLKGRDLRRVRNAVWQKTGMVEHVELVVIVLVWAPA